jgi:hypothetical protein
MFRFIAHIEARTGKIVRIEFPQRDIPPEGINGDDRVVYITDANLPSEECGKNLKHFIDEYWWNDGFVWLGKKPNKHATWNFDTSSWEWDSELLLQDLRSARNSKLRQSDWTQMPDSPLGELERGWWAAYRQQLRDLPQNVSDITSLDDVVWPIPPN